jgi:hypothetical protein
MGLSIVRSLGDLGDDLILAPERYHPSRTVAITSRRCLADLVDLSTQNAPASSLADKPVLVLDTSHAYEGLVICRHDPVPATALGSAKRRIQPGDVIVSRLRPYLRQVAFVDAALFRQVPGGNHVVASTEFFVLRNRNDFPAAALVPFLLSAPVQSALAAGQEGGHHPRFSLDLLASLRVPDRLVTRAIPISRRVHAQSQRLRRSLRESRQLIAQTQALLDP